MNNMPNLNKLISDFARYTPPEKYRKVAEPTTYEKVAAVAHKVESLLAAGYSYEGCTEGLNELGVEMSVSTLKSYMRKIRKASAK